MTPPTIRPARLTKFTVLKEWKEAFPIPENLDLELTLNNMLACLWGHRYFKEKDPGHSNMNLLESIAYAQDLGVELRIQGTESPIVVKKHGHKDFILPDYWIDWVMRRKS